VGSNFRCGYHLDTDAPAIQEFNAGRGILTSIVQPLTDGDEPISSRLIRACISQGKLHKAAAMLGRPFTVDLADAPAVPAGKAGFGITYDIAAQGRVLPPPGRYPVVLIGKDGDRSAGKAAEIQVEGGNVIISKDAGEGEWEYVEFCKTS